ncbi:MAG: CRISPR-associated endonuclease Cas2 [Porphyromonas sp.]|nr:CRISPR-associated endonuclease Cas2 [Bacteroidales bacterium]MDY3101379.1 CRISPR-associated endonuclease Cas2 [Porphyromonas sp.]
MYILVTYDVNTVDPAGAKRLREVAKVCRNYGQRVQNSVFECLVEPATYVELKDKLLSIINKERDSLRFYHIGNNYRAKIEIFGCITSFDIQGELIV